MDFRNVLVMISVLFLIPTLDKGGAENVLINLVNNMDLNKYSITVQTLFDNESQKDKLKKGINYKTFLHKQFKGNSKIISYVPKVVLYKTIVKDKYDVLISYLEGPTTKIICGCPYKNSKKISWIHTQIENSIIFSSGFTNYNEAFRAYSSMDCICCVAKKVEKSFLSITNGKINNTKVVYNTINCKEIVNQSKEKIDSKLFLKEEFNCVSVGRLVRQKGYKRLIKVFSDVITESRIKAHLYIIGTGKESKELKDLAKVLGIESNVSFLGFQNNPYKFVSKADLFICSSYEEGISTSVTESLIVGTPVISTDCSGAKELLGEKSEYGLIVDNSESGLYEGIMQLINDKNMFNDLRKKAIERGKTFENNETVKCVEGLIDRLWEK